MKAQENNAITNSFHTSIWASIKHSNIDGKSITNGQFSPQVSFTLGVGISLFNFKPAHLPNLYHINVSVFCITRWKVGSCLPMNDKKIVEGQIMVLIIIMTYLVPEVNSKKRSNAAPLKMNPGYANIRGWYHTPNPKFRGHNCHCLKYVKIIQL